MSYIRPFIRQSRDRRRLPGSFLPTAAGGRARHGLCTGRRRAARQRRLRRLLRDIQDDLLLERSLKPDRRGHSSHERLFDEAQADEAQADEALADEDAADDKSFLDEDVRAAEDSVAPAKTVRAAMRADL